MPRQPRPDFAGIAQHIVQRGNDRLPCFFEEADYRRYLSNLRESALKARCQVHAYVLMTNHVHLLATPEAPGMISSMMQALGRRYVAYINGRYRRTGTLWEGRYKACLVDSPDYVLVCYRYIELNPVRACMVASPEDYRWSSFHHNANGQDDPLVLHHPDYQALASNSENRHNIYLELFNHAISEERLSEIRA